MKKNNNFYLQLDYITNFGKERTKYFCNRSSLLRSLENSGFFAVSVYDYNTHKFIFRCSERDLFVKKLLICLRDVV